MVPCHLVLCLEFFTTWHHASSGRTHEGVRESTSKTEVMVTCNLITEETASHFCHIHFFRSKLLGLFCTQGEIKQGYEYQDLGIIGSPVRSCLPQDPLLSLDFREVYDPEFRVLNVDFILNNHSEFAGVFVFQSFHVTFLINESTLLYSSLQC